MAKRKTDEEVKAEIKALKAIQPKVRHYSAFGTDNWANVKAQIRVLEEDLDTNDIYDRYEDIGEEILMAALDALNWMNGESDMESLAEDWSGIAE